MIALGIGLIGARSTATRREEAGMVAAATWVHDPGAAHKSRTTLEDCRKEYFLLRWISLKAARAR